MSSDPLRPPTLTFVPDDVAPTTSSSVVDVPARFAVEREIARGAMGVVLAAVDRQRDRPIALKVARVDSGDPATYRARLVREAEATRLVRHPGVAEIYDVDVDGHWLAMERIPGESLAARAARGPIVGADLVRLGRELLDVLAAAHAAGVVHRDVKPSNILIEPDGRLRLVDFGIAWVPESDLTRAGALLGTPRYMAPEQLRGSGADHRSDLFAVAATLTELATGRAAHVIVEAGEDVERVLAAALDDRHLARVIASGLEESPARRPADAAAFARALAVGPPRRRRIALGLVGAGALALAATLYVTLRPAQAPATDALTRGIAALAAGNLSDAETRLGEALSARPDDARADYRLALIAWWRGAPATEVEPRLERALAAPLSPEERGFAAGLRLLTREDHAGAIDHFTALVASYPGDRWALYGRFEAEYHGGEPARAVATYRELGELDEHFALGAFHLAEYYLLHGDDPGLRWTLDRLERVGYPELEIWRIRALIARREYGAARLRLEERLAANPGDAEAAQQRRWIVALELNARELTEHAGASYDGDGPEELAARVGAALAVGDPARAATWRARLAHAGRVAPAPRARFDAWAYLAAFADATMPEADEAVAGLAELGASVPGLTARAQALRVLVAIERGDRGQLDALRSSAFPEVRALVAAGLAADANAAATAWDAALPLAATGAVRLIVSAHRARLARDRGDPAAVRQACDEVLRPRAFDWAWARFVGECLAATAEALTTAGDAVAARDRWRQLLSLRGDAPADDPLARAARAALAGPHSGVTP